ncbi:MAG: GNAT family N-acetyltransferase [Candidatus Promineifilaceae bacterium]|nr:GNAT family N-acetyltransferase [Candidatus Promineifilaceae bacterium]
MVLIEIRHAVDDPIFKRRRYLYVSEIAVAVPLRGSGIGRMLIDKVHQFAHTQNIVEVELNVWERNDPAISFYEKIGYQNWRRTMRYIIDEDAYFEVKNQET